MKRSSQSCRLRKVTCEHCGYTIRMARSWMTVGLPVCPCGTPMRPETPADLAWCGLIGQEDMKPADWTAVCRENGWEDQIVRRGNAAKQHDRRELEQGGIMGRRAGAAHCVFAGCGRWIAEGADRCTAGHAQHDHAEELAAIPF